MVDTHICIDRRCFFLILFDVIFIHHSACVLVFSSFLSFAVLERQFSLVTSSVGFLVGSGLGLSDWELFKENPVF